MSSHSILSVGAVDLCQKVDDFFDAHTPQLSLFHEDEQYIQNGTASELGLQARSRGRGRSIDSDTECTVIQYRSNVRTVTDRLEMQGFSLATAQEGFDKGLEAEKERCRELIEQHNDDFYRSRLEAVEELNFAVWSSLLMRMLSLNKGSGSSIRIEDDLIHVAEYMAERGSSCFPNGPFGFPGYEMRHFVRVALEFFGTGDSVVLDLTEFALRGMQPENVADCAESVMSENYNTASKTIVVTEGKSDVWMIERSLKLLLPHLASYFRFMDFDGANIGGGAGNLANIAKAFSGAGIENKIVALFDNDTAASDALRSIKSAALPENILSLQYPHFDKLERYPTIGQTGTSREDVNGRAGSIELYLGEECLRDENGDLSPVKWKSYNQSVGTHQGAVLNKKDITRRFDDKLSACEKDPDLIPNYDWTGVRLILEELQYAFHQRNAERILSDYRRY